MKPTLAQELVFSRRRSATSKRVSQALVFAITSGKGGVGKTNGVANLAAALAQRKKRGMVIDADLGLANLALFLGSGPHTHWRISLLAWWLSTKSSSRTVTVSSTSRPAGAEVTVSRHDQKIALLTELDALSHEVDLVLVDTGSGISDAVTYFCHFGSGNRSGRNAGTFVHE
jgi:flagellar biosynthesis protein FlhG